MINENSSVHDEQFGSNENPSKNTENKDQELNKENENSGIDSSEETSEKKDDNVKETTSDEVKSEDSGINPDENNKSGNKEEKDTSKDDDPVGPDKDTPEQETKEPDLKATDQENTSVKSIDYSKYSKKQLVDALEAILLTESVEAINDDVEKIKILFYKKYKSHLDEVKNNFLKEGGNIEDFKPADDNDEIKLKELLNKHQELRTEHNKRLEEEKTNNLVKKQEIIENIKDLVNRKESINKTFNEFRELQNQWRNIGLVPQQNLKDLWESYHLACEMFYDYIKINKDLRDLDLKKNLEAKITLCEKAEKLLLEPSVVNAFKTLQIFHDQWREIGPVPHDQKTELWERFKEITSKINKKHHQYFEQLKDSQKTNLQEKTILCEKVEEINTIEITTAKEWEEKSKEIIEIQRMWKTIGFAPKKDNNKIYNRFRTACDLFFNNKRAFFASNKEEQKNNLQIKTDLCVQAETLKDSKDWKETTEALINLQKRWKEVGPVPKKYSDQLWDRFRSACDTFFNNKEEFFSNIDSSYDENLKRKNDLITEIENYKFSDKTDDNFTNINEFQKRWSEIGFVPLKNKEEIQTRYREAINKLFDKLKIDEDEKYLLKFENKLNDILSKPNAGLKIRQEREKLIKRLTKIEGDLVVWENNVGFFAKSKGADSLIKDVKLKIENAKTSIELIQQKIRAIDELRETNNID